MARLVIVNWDEQPVQVVDVEVLFDKRNSAYSKFNTTGQKYYYVRNVKLNDAAAGIKTILDHRGRISVQLVDNEENIWTNTSQPQPPIGLEEARVALANAKMEDFFGNINGARAQAWRGRPVGGAREQQEKVRAMIAAKAAKATTDDARSSLIIFSEGARMLAEASTIQRTKELMNLALTAADWLKRSNAGKDAVASARAYALDAEKKMGKLLSGTKLADGGTAARGARSTHTTEVEPKLSDLGITKDASSKAQKLAALDAETYAAIKNGTMSKSAALVSAGGLPTARNRGQNEVARELAAMTKKLQSWVDQFSVEYLRHQYATECKQLRDLLSIVIG